MHLDKRIRIQLCVFVVVSLVAASIMAFGYIKLPAMFGIERYQVTLVLPRSGGLYPTSNVTYRGTQVGKVESIGLADGGGVRAVLSLQSNIAIPSNLTAEVHSQTAAGEQFVALLPRDDTSVPLGNGDVIAGDRITLAPDIDNVLDGTERGLQAIPGGNLKTAVDEAYTAFGGLGPELSRIVKGSTALASDARANLDALTGLVDQSAPVLESQSKSADAIQAWAAHTAEISGQLRDHDADLAALIDNGGPAADSAHQLVDRLKPTLPVILANLVTVGAVALTYRNDIEQLLVLLPQTVATIQGSGIANRHIKSPYAGGYLDFKLNANLPPPCTTGFLPAQQKRTPEFTDYPDRPAGDLYCRVPQDSPFNVRGARNIPCETVPGKRAPTVKMCESDEQYVPLNDGYNWKGDPNATNTGQSVPQLAPGEQTSKPSPPPLAIAHYDPATGAYVGPDGKVFVASDLVGGSQPDKTWQSMLLPPGTN